MQQTRSDISVGMSNSLSTDLVTLLSIRLRLMNQMLLLAGLERLHLEPMFENLRKMHTDYVRNCLRRAQPHHDTTHY
jgi:hypothetical protein